MLLLLVQRFGPFRVKIAGVYATGFVSVVILIDLLTLYLYDP